LQKENRSVVYVLSSTEKGVDVYFGVVSDDKRIDMHDSGTALKLPLKAIF
jgi:hypothetical protein